MITVKNESKIFLKRLYHTNPNVCLIRENVIQIKSTIMITVHVSECRKHYIYTCIYIYIYYIYIKDYIWNLATCSCENGKYLARIMDNSEITCDESIKES